MDDNEELGITEHLRALGGTGGLTSVGTASATGVESSGRGERSKNRDIDQDLAVRNELNPPEHRGETNCRALKG